MSILPVEILKIIFSYKEDFELHEKKKKLNKEINNLKIEYHIPYTYSISYYVMKVITSSVDRNFFIGSIICICCGRNIHETFDEYIDYIEDRDNELENMRVFNDLMYIEDYIYTEFNENKTMILKLDDYSYLKYKRIAEILFHNNVIKESKLTGQYSD